MDRMELLIRARNIFWHFANLQYKSRRDEQF